ncbi:Uroporphyrinogen-III synthase [uncultured Gammaproteobacteria bacterium]
MARVLLTRPREDSEPLAERLRDQGFEVLIEPLLDVEWLDLPLLGLDPIQSLLFTSANGVRAFTRLCPRRDHPVYAVGDATARVARAAGFATVLSADGDAEALARLVAERCTPAGGALLHVAGTVAAGDLAGALRGQGFTVERQVLYRARTAERLSSEGGAAMHAGTVDAVLVYSPRTARTLVEVIEADDLRETCRTVRALCLSPAVAEVLSPLPWRAVEVAPRPREDALLALLGID